MRTLSIGIVLIIVLLVLWWLGVHFGTLILIHV